MSYQLIYKHRGISKKKGEPFGVLVKSQDIPSWLEDMVLFTGKGSGSMGMPRRYTYRTVRSEGGDYHVLACEENGVIHHLILTPTEGAKVRRNANRPTPAGIMLALEKCDFWVTDPKHHALHCEEPRLAASNLPDADFQQTWKDITGHKNNAKVFLTQPYHQACLVLLPNHSTCTDALRLLHESDWISSLRGWGRTFTTAAQMGDSFEEISRICIPKKQLATPVGAVLSRQAPILDLSEPFLLTELKENKDSAKPQQQQTPPAQHAEENAHFPYVYQETPDEDVYNIPPRTHPILRWVLYMTGLALLGMGVHALVSQTADDAGQATRKAIESIARDDGLIQLRELTKVPYSPDSITHSLNKLYAHLKATPPSTVTPNKERVLAIIAILKSAVSDTKGHAGNILLLQESAKELQLNPQKLIRLYLNEATHDCSVQDWENNLTPAELESWGKLLETAPTVRELLQEEPFAPYSKLILQPNTPLTAPATNQTQTDTGADTQQQTLTCIEGDVLPDAFVRTLKNTPFSICQGHWSIIRRHAGTTLRTRFSGELGKSGQSLRVERRGTNTYHIEPSDGNAFPALQFKVAEGKLQELQCEDGNPAAAILPLPGENGSHCSIMLLPHREVIFKPKDEQSPPESHQLDLELGESDIVLHKESQQLEVVGDKGYPWTRMLSELPLQQGAVVLHLPILNGVNKLTATQTAEQSDFYWSYSKLPTSNTTSDLYDCHLLRVYDFSHDLKQQFHKQANSYCMGEKAGDDTFYSLATLYALCLDAEQPAHIDEATKTLLRLAEHPDFSAILHRIMAAEPTLQETEKPLTPQAAMNLLSHAETRLAIRRSILANLSAGIQQTYTICREREMKKYPQAPHMELCLQHVQLSDQGELLWSFDLRKKTEQ